MSYTASVTSFNLFLSETKWWLALNIEQWNVRKDKLRVDGD